MNTFLFVGGSRDGHHIQVDGGITMLNLPSIVALKEAIENPHAEIKLEGYRRVNLILRNDTEKDVLTVFAFEDIDDSQVFTFFIRNYRRADDANSIRIHYNV